MSCQENNFKHITLHLRAIYLNINFEFGKGNVTVEKNENNIDSL